MDKLIPVINKLQDVFNAVTSEGIDLPQIVVIGSQSAGKSSVLENIVGRDFLPRGSGIVTRRPLILKLINIPSEGKAKETDSSIEEWGEFDHARNKTFYDFSLIREEIQKATDAEVGTNKGVSAKPISLTIYSPHVLNLTLVDLPGMTKVPVGDQPKDIDRQIREMNKLFIQRPNAIIVAVTPANIDLANSDALQLAKEVDPEGLRTIGVITKIDLMDKGTNAVEILTNRVLNLKLGFVGIVCRSQEDIIQNRPIREALVNEKKFFSTHSAYRNIAHKMGSQYLAQTLNKLLLDHIHHCLPDLKSKITESLVDAERELQSYGDPLYDERTNKGGLLLSILTKFSNDYKGAIEGKLNDSNAKELYGGARISFIFNEIYVGCLKTMSPFDGLELNDIRTAIRNATGPNTALFVPEISFELLTKRQIIRLLEPSLQCVDYVFEELMRIVSQLESKELLRFEVLRTKIVEVVTELLNECRIPTRLMIENLIKIELSYINTAHPDFIGSEGSINQLVDERVREKEVEIRKKMEENQRAQAEAEQAALQFQQQQLNQKNPTKQPVVPARNQPAPTPAMNPRATFNPNNPSPTPNPQGLPIPTSAITSAIQSKSAGQNPKPKKKPTANSRNSLDSVPINIKSEGALSEKEKYETSLIRSLIQSYFNIVRTNTQDTIPKSIMYFLVNQSKELMHNRLVEKLYKEESFDVLLGESPEIVARRKAAKDSVSKLKRATEILNEVRDFTFK